MFKKNLFIAALLLTLLAESLLPTGLALASSDGRPEPEAIPQQLFLPVVNVSYPAPQYPDMQAIWTNYQSPERREYALFRKTVNLPSAQSGLALHIFADTRYEVYLDGGLLGRGPAVFSRQTQEYDVYELPRLDAGKHLIAVLVQFAPVERRSESYQPALYARLVHTHGGVLATTDESWKAFQPDAWAGDSANVHAWKLIGPTELLDLNRLPAGWYQRGFDDSRWEKAVVVDRPLGEKGLTPRSIPLLADYPVWAGVFDSGRLSPGYVFGELHPSTRLPYEMDLQADGTARLTVEVVSVKGAPPADLMSVDGNWLNWSALGPDRLDVYAASLNLKAGRSTLTVHRLPSDGLSFALSGDGVYFPKLPASMGVHAGRRLLLGQPQSDGSAVSVSDLGDSLDITLQGEGAYVVLDTGRVIHGRLLAEVSGPAGTVLDIGWADRLYQDRRPLSYPGSLAGGTWDQTDSWVLDGGQRPITTVDTRAGRYIILSAWGGGTVHLGNLRVVETRYPGEPVGSFVSDDERLNRIWQVGVDTLYPNMVDYYGETWRERGQWWGDASVTHEINRVVFGDQRLLARGLRLMAEPLALTGMPNAVAPNGHGQLLDYAMLWVHDTAEYVRYTDDTQLAADIYPQIMQLLQYLSQYKESDGLLNIPEGPWGDTDYLDSCAWWDRWGVSTAMNSLYYDTLLDTAYLAGRLGKGGDAQRFTAEAENVKGRINARLYDPASGRYYATLIYGGFKPATQLSQAYALNFGVVPQENVARVVDAMIQLTADAFQRKSVGTYAFRWILGGLGRYGYIQEATEMIGTYYGTMLDRGATTWWETFNSIENFSSGLVHAWSGSPTWFLTTYVLGAQSADGVSWSVQPGLAGVGSASGTLPLQNGQLLVTWETAGRGQASVSLSAPEWTAGRLVLPETFGSATITVDGEVVWQGGPLSGSGELVGGRLEITIPGGQHQVDILP